ncbi:YheC/D-like protein [Anoxybacillus vitaminiphilus]|uniref:YheC/D-like protein n=1 Tax=Paranoxybacillus vitaminiphilus TaxID=581036 RepID=A0A327YG03_9BACL|nr:YheC/YheD family protein [Anoxybacillus vitaminiphilus]RAK19461.1 YheC/D-like protein [Anoxybacillus vitaminiphilus]
MISFGFLTIREHQEHEYATEMAKRASLYGIEMYRFTPLSIDPLTEKVNGEKFSHELQSWVSCLFDIPTFIYDRCFYHSDSRSKQSKPIVQWLKKRPDLVFLGNGLPNKWELYESLRAHPLLSPYTVKTWRITSVHDVIEALKSEKNIILKPETGSQGKGMYSLKQTKHSLQIESTSKEDIQIINSKAELKAWAEKQLQLQSYIGQPLLPLKNKYGQPFDLRLLLQKDEHGQWKERGRGIRIGEKETFIANVSAGAAIIPFKEWMSQIPELQQVLINDGIDTIITLLPSYLDETHGQLFEIGLDIGITDEGAVWILDVNSKPGRKIVLETSPHEAENLYHAPLRYCRFLFEGVEVR